MRAVNVPRFPLFGCAVLCLVVAAGCYRDTGEGELTVTREADRAAERAGAPSPTPPARPSDEEFSERLLAEAAAGRKNAARLSEAQRKKAYLEITSANRAARKLIVRALATGTKKPGDSGQWAYDTYRKPLLRKYHISEDGGGAIEEEGIDKDWPTQPLSP